MKPNKKGEKKKNWLQKAREGWSNTGEERPPFAIEPKKGQRSVWDFPRPPIIEKVNKSISIDFEGDRISQSNDALAVLETASPPTYYIPKYDIDMNKLQKISGKTSMCEWKGSADYWALKTFPERPVAWSYSNPFEEFAALKEHIAFYPQHLECCVDGKQVVPQAGEFYAGWITPDLTGPFKGEMGTGHW